MSDGADGGRRVFLLGAGASKSYGQSPTGQRMPIARDFFQTYLSLDISANPWVLIDGLVTYLRKTREAVDPITFLSSGIDIEALHSEIEQARDVLMARGDSAATFLTEARAFNELVFLFASVLNEIQNGPTSRPHVKLARALRTDDAVITFNWDTLMDRAMAETTSWRPDWGYGVTPRRIFRNGWGEPLSNRNEDGAPALIKLHGSTNWLTGHPTRDPDTNRFVHTHALEPDAFAVFESATAPYDCFAGRYMEGYKPYAYGYYPPNLDFEGRAAPDGYKIVSVRPRIPGRPEGLAGERGLVSIPLIIPPVRNKRYDDFGELFGHLWQSAEQKLAEADEIVVIGYSFPPTDTQSDTLFRHAFSKRSSMPKMVVVDPAPDRIIDKLSRELGIIDSHLTIIRDYFDENLDLGARLGWR